MIYVSLSILALALGTTATALSQERASIGAQLGNGNPLAWALLAAICALLFLFARRLNKNSHRIRTSLLLVDVGGLIAIATTSNPRAQELILLVLCLLTPLWFYIVGLDYDCTHVTSLSGVCSLALPVLTACSLAIAEIALIFYAVYCINVLYFLHLDPKGRTRWP